MAKMIKVTVKEYRSINEAWHYLNNVYEGCTGNKRTLRALEKTLDGLTSVTNKFRATKSNKLE